MPLLDRERCDTLVLAALEAADRNGDEILRHLERTTGRLPRPSVRQVYTTLHRLERNRLVARSRGDGRRRRLTDTGLRVLRARVAAAQAYGSALKVVTAS
ncbi:PadR family transcriptional regulator [Actinomycetospora termitidis]|uniref:Helix-turn-helix transcriptional regulator n=1 Tax=Actinomycetospora termitidis TaxID=3053470 RepID=A0ABT7MHA1_9PSEU|nr:helix-turn-helix transcriptional regulator [Actinomycetospora sp. Odt1-22]MDL5160050.1 helix-turn-helix transcriptional regulator [Actinomycetospora sp. Odt1-22]